MVDLTFAQREAEAAPPPSAPEPAPSAHERARIRGKLTDAYDRPIAAARVRVSYWSARWKDDVVPVEAEPFTAEGGAELELALDAAGEFAFELVVPLNGTLSCAFSAGPWHETRSVCLSARTDSTECALLTSGDHWLEPVRLGAVGRLTGRVLSSDGAPISGAAVYVGDGRSSARTRADGSYCIDRIAPGVVTIAAYAPARAAAALEDIRVEAGRMNELEDLVLQSARAGTVRGQVVDSDGAPIGGVRLEARLPGDPTPAIEHVSAVDGSFELTVEAERLYQLQISDWRVRARLYEHSEVRAGDHKVRLNALRLVRHRVQVIDAETGRPIERHALHWSLPPGHQVILRWSSLQHARHAAGTQEIDIDPDRQWIRCSSPGYALHEGLARESIDGPGSIRLALRRGGIVRGRLVNGAGRGLTLTLGSAESSGEHATGTTASAGAALARGQTGFAGKPRWTSCAQDGSFEFDSLNAGAYELRYGGVEEAAPLRTGLRVNEGGVLDLGALDHLALGGVIFGRVLVAPGGSARGQSLLCHDLGKRGVLGPALAAPAATLGDDGGFMFAGLAGGEYELSIRERTHSRLGVHRRSVSIAAGEHRRVEWDLSEYEPAWLELEVRDARHSLAGTWVNWSGLGDSDGLGELDQAGRVAGPVPPGKVRVFIASLGTHTLGEELLAGGRYRHTIDIECGELTVELPDAASGPTAVYSISGQSWQADGSASILSVRATHDVTRSLGAKRIDAQGAVAIGHLAPGRWELHLRKKLKGAEDVELGSTFVNVIAGEHARARFEP